MSGRARKHRGRPARVREGQMRVVLTGATGMVGGGVLQACLEDEGIEAVLSVARRKVGIEHRKLTQLVMPDLFDLAAHGDALSGFDACLYCLGVSAVGMSEAEYRRVTHDLTLAVVDALSRRNPDLVVCYVSGRGSDRAGRSRWMWARVKGEAENALFARDVAAYTFRPGLVQPLRAHRPRSPSQRVVVGIVNLVFPLLRALSPGLATSAVDIGRAMIAAARGKPGKKVFEPRDMDALASTRTRP
ncbi:MAG: NAD-dependent epimerase/dehydratase family protein [Gemmatimonadetes bacterium]|nr:NAD-dependent epimerase/dehydratase family protein [Gemmatimonadota bacterium]MYE16660.1 NAD-dependent epimerase/dehydratase family protein [Gemmatimonadota bacterium]